MASDTESISGGITGALGTVLPIVMHTANGYNSTVGGGGGVGGVGGVGATPRRRIVETLRGDDFDVDDHGNGGSGRGGGGPVWFRRRPAHK